MTESYDVVCVGTGFATSFFLHKLLRHARPDARILVLERGSRDPHRWQLQNKRNSRQISETLFRNHTPHKPWVFTSAFGGGSNCWWAVTPRMLPSDFELRTRYGVGRDWPLGYNDIEAFYAEAERLMSVSGPATRSPYPASRRIHSRRTGSLILIGCCRWPTPNCSSRWRLPEPGSKAPPVFLDTD